jgi:O-antigen/teichoic acid export membrane protein
MAGRLLAMLVAAAIAGLLVVRRFRLRWNARSLRAALRGTLPFAASTGFSVIYGRADLAIIGNELGKAAAGIYAPALTLTNTVFLIPVAVYEVMLPMLSRRYASHPTWVKRTSLWLTAVMVLLGLGLGLGLAWTSQLLIELLYGRVYGASSSVLALLSNVLVLRCPSIALSATLVAVGWQVPRVGVQAVAAILNVVLNLLVVHPLGVMGVASVYVLTEIVLLMGHLVLFILWLVRT